MLDYPPPEDGNKDIVNYQKGPTPAAKDSNGVPGEGNIDNHQKGSKLSSHGLHSTTIIHKNNH